MDKKKYNWKKKSINIWQTKLFGENFKKKIEGRRVSRWISWIIIIRPIFNGKHYKNIAVKKDYKIYTFVFFLTNWSKNKFFLFIFIFLSFINQT